MKLSLNTLYIVSTPIGNLDDITLRAIEVLKKSDIILCEDTRHSLKLMNHLKIKKKLISYHKFNEKKQLTNIVEHIKTGKILSLISDAGTPLLSDPGRILINECISRKIKIVPIPGVSSITTAMSVSGFKDKFLFYGFLPKKIKELNTVLNILASCKFSLIFFVPGLKVNFYINRLKDFFDGRKVMIAKELTKIHEEIIFLKLSKIENYQVSLKGEITLVVSNDNNNNKPINMERIINKAKNYLKKYSVKDTVDLIIKTENISKKDVYQICLNIKNEENN